MIKIIQNPFFQSLLKLILFYNISSHCIIKVMNLLYYMPETGKYWFTIYYLYYKDKFVNNLTLAFICAINNLYFLFHFSNFLASLKREKCQKLSYGFFLNLTISKMHSTMFKYRVISKCMIMTK